MNKNTANKLHIIKAAYGVVIGVLFQLAFQLPTSIGAQMAFVFAVILLYVLPFIVNVEYIKTHAIDGIKRFITGDLLFLFPESFISCVITEYIITSSMDDAEYFSGMGTMIFGGVALLTMLCFWGAYAAVNKLYKEE